MSVISQRPQKPVKRIQPIVSILTFLVEITLQLFLDFAVGLTEKKY